MKDISSVTKKIGEITTPKLTIDLAKIFGFAPISLEIPLPEILNPFKKNKDNQSLNYNRFFVKVRGWIDGKFSSKVTIDELSSFENGVREKYLKEVTKIEHEVYSYQVGIDNAFETAHGFVFSSSEAIKSVESRFNDWIDTFKDELNYVRSHLEEQKIKKSSLESSLNSFVKSENLISSTPNIQSSFVDKFAGIIILSFLDVMLSFWLISDKPTLAIIQAIGLSSVVSILNIGIGLLVGSIILYKAIHSKNQILKTSFYVMCGLFSLMMILVNIKFAFWRDDDLEVIKLTFNLIPLSAFSFALLILGFAIYAFSIHKGYQEFTSGHPGHNEKYKDFKNAEITVENLKLIEINLKKQLRHTALNEIELVRTEISKYFEKIILARKSVKAYASNLEANFKYWPSVFENIYVAASTVLKAYREGLWSSFKNITSDSFKYPTLEKRQISFDLDNANSKVSTILSSLDKIQNDLLDFQRSFEDQTVSKIREKLDQICSLSSDETVSANNNLKN